MEFQNHINFYLVGVELNLIFNNQLDIQLTINPTIKLGTKLPYSHQEVCIFELRKDNRKLWIQNNSPHHLNGIVHRSFLLPHLKKNQ